MSIADRPMPAAAAGSSHYITPHKSVVTRWTRAAELEASVSDRAMLAGERGMDCEMDAALAAET